MTRPEGQRGKISPELSGEEPARKRLAVAVPGSTANLGPGFDTLGLALSIYTRLTFDLLEKNDPSVPLVTLRGPIAGSLAADRSNLAFQVLTNLWRNQPDLLGRVRITIESDIPLGRGLGSSGTAIVGTIWASYALAGSTVDQGRLLAEATEIEGHPDNIAASLLGGLVVCGRSADGSSIQTRKMTWPDDWHTLVVVPDYSLTTESARAVLPDRVSMPDAVANVQRVALLVSAVASRDEDVLKEALHDRLHEPYRLALVPELGRLRQELGELPVLGCVLSGAGSSVLVIVHKRHKGEVLDFLRLWCARQKEPPRVLDLKVDQRGLRELESR